MRAKRILLIKLSMGLKCRVGRKTERIFAVVLNAFLDPQAHLLLLCTRADTA